jgi:hypothetical protein
MIDGQRQGATLPTSFYRPHFRFPRRTLSVYTGSILSSSEPVLLDDPAPVVAGVSAFPLFPSRPLPRT